MFPLFFFALDVQNKFSANDMYEYSSELNKRQNMSSDSKNSLLSEGQTKQWLNCVEKELKNQSLEGYKKKGGGDGSDFDSGSASKSGSDQSDDSTDS